MVARKEQSDYLMLCTKHNVFLLVNIEIEAFEQTLSLLNHGKLSFCKNTKYWYSCKFLKN